MEHTTAEVPLGVWAQLLRLAFVLAIPAAAVLVARYRSSWLLPAWLATWLVLAAVNLITNPSALEYGPLAAVAEIVPVGVATGLPVLWLHLGRRHPVFSRLAVQFVGAVVAFVAGIGAAAAMLAAMWAVT